MPTSHIVTQGECVASICNAAGLFWKSVWEAPENDALRASRASPYLLLPGDVLHLPEKTPRKEAGSTEQRHRFQRKGRRVWLRLRVLDHGQPRAGEEYLLRVETLEFTGRTDSDGRIEHRIPSEAAEAFLRLDGRVGAEDYILKIGALDPANELSGVQARLCNLGFDPGTIDGIMGAQTEKAIRSFQKEHALEVTGRADEQTWKELEKAHGC